MKKKLAFIVQRYGLEVNGGAETLAREMAEHLNEQFDVTVLTTKAVEYTTWADYYEQDQEQINGVTVRRFSVTEPRDSKKFGKFCGKVLDDPNHTMEQEQQWFDMQGPQAPGLISYIVDHKDDYDAFLFMTYLYYTTVKGLPQVADKAILIPTAHDEPPIYLKTFEQIFTMPKALYYLTKEEKVFVEKKFGNAGILNNDGVGGSGIEVPLNPNRDYVKKELGIEHYMLYAGRIDESKGCKEMFRSFKRYKRRHKEQKDLKLVLIGKAAMRIPHSKDIVSLGFVSEQMKYDVMSGAQFLIMPSPYESLSIVVLEAMALSVPVLCNGKCEVLKGHCIRSGAGLFYEDYVTFEQEVGTLLTDQAQINAMRHSGAGYVEQNYTWAKIMDTLVRLIDQVDA